MGKGRGIMDDLGGDESGIGRYLPAWKLGTEELQTPDLYKALGAEFLGTLLFLCVTPPPAPVSAALPLRSNSRARPRRAAYGVYGCRARHRRA